MLNRLNIAIVLILSALVIIPFFTRPADARPSTRAYTCEGVWNLINRRGAIVMDTKNSNVYRRFVKNRSYCPSDMVLFQYLAPTRDGRCQLYICRSPETDFFGGGLRRN